MHSGKVVEGVAEHGDAYIFCKVGNKASSVGNVFELQEITVGTNSRRSLFEASMHLIPLSQLSRTPLVLEQLKAEEELHTPSV